MTFQTVGSRESSKFIHQGLLSINSMRMSPKWKLICYDEDMANVIIVPGRGIESDGTLPVDALSRVRKAVELYKKRRALKIIMSGGYSYHLTSSPDISEAHAMKQYAESLGVAGKDIVEEDKSTHTLANAYFTKKLICEPNQWKDIIVVASDEHMPRVEYIFKKVFGTRYSFQFEISDRIINDQDYADQLQHEKASLDRTIMGLDGVTDGDDQTIRNIIVANRPNDTMAEDL